MINLEIEEGVATATLCRAPVNAINEEWIDRLGEILDDIDGRSDVSVLLFRSTERIFCAGADLSLMSSRFETEEGRKLMVAFVRRLQAVYARVEAMPVVSIAEIGGAAMGGGLELALSCDLRIAANTANLGLPEAQLGLLPGAGGTQRLTRLCGDAVSRRLILGGETITGAVAAELGVVQWAVAADELASFAADHAARISVIPKEAVKFSKLCIEAALNADANGFEVEVEGTGQLFAHPETQAKVKKFLAGSK